MKNPPPLPPLRAKRTPRLFFLLAAALFAGLVLVPARPGGVGLLSRPCAFHAATGLPCAFCGGSRAVRAAAAGDWERAFYLNPAAVLTAGVAAIALVVLAWEALTGRAVIRPVLSRFPPSARVWAMAAFFAALLPWTVFHAWDALSRPKPEIANANHPVARSIKEFLSR